MQLRRLLLAAAVLTTVLVGGAARPAAAACTVSGFMGIQNGGVGAVALVTYSSYVQAGNGCAIKAVTGTAVQSTGVPAVCAVQWNTQSNGFDCMGRGVGVSLWSVTLTWTITGAASTGTPLTRTGSCTILMPQVGDVSGCNV